VKQVKPMKPDYDSLPIHALKDAVLKLLGEGWSARLTPDRAGYESAPSVYIHAYFEKIYMGADDKEAVFEATILYEPKYSYNSSSLRDHWEVRIGYCKSHGNFQKPESMAREILRNHENTLNTIKWNRETLLKTEALDAKIRAEFSRYAPGKNYSHNTELKDAKDNKIVEFGCWNYDLNDIEIRKVHKRVTLDRFRRILAIIEE
jgi:hypothetical protein